MMHITKLEPHISRFAVKVLEENGISSLFPPQEDAVKKGLFGERNMVIAIPTASGKTLIAELAMLHAVLHGGKALYTVPLRALAAEKFEDFKKWEQIGLKIGMSMGDYEARDEWLGDCDIIVTTSEKADSLIRNGARWIKDVTCLVVDEIHLLDSAKRGAVLEVLIAKLRKVNPDIRILALSATIPNASEIAEWLDAELIKSEWRPTPLYEGVICRGRLELYKDGIKIAEKSLKGDAVASLVKDTLEDGGSVLIFDSTRRNAEATAVKLSATARRYAEFERPENLEELTELAKAILEENEGEMSQKLAECVRHGVAFHHAGLLNEQRKVVEDAFRQGMIRVVVATPTLAAGVNLPARRVIIKSYRRFDGYSKPIKVLEYKQMAGRAGRPGMDEWGEAVVIARKESDKDFVLNNYVLGEPERVESKLGSEAHLRFHSLSIIAEGFARTLEELEGFFSSTFFFHQNEVSARYELERIIGQLEKWEMVEWDGNVSPTEFGRLVSRLYIDPMTGFIFRDTLSRSEVSEIGALHLICRSPDMELLYVRRSEEWIEEEALALKERLTYAPSVYSSDYDWFLSEVKTALCLHDWINERDEDVICDKFSIAPGDLRRVVETAQWLMHALRRVAEHLAHPQTGFFAGLEERLNYGVKEELLDLIRLKGIGRVRARKLYRHGIKSVDDIIASKDKLPMIIGKGIAEKVLRQLGVE
jgi:helicase